MLYLPTFNWDFAGYYLRDETLIRDTVIKRLNYTGVVKKQFYYKRQNDIATVNQALHWYIIYFFTQSYCCKQVFTHEMYKISTCTNIKCLNQMSDQSILEG